MVSLLSNRGKDPVTHMVGQWGVNEVEEWEILLQNKDRKSVGKTLGKVAESLMDV